MAGILYIVATPIGNLEDLSGRAKKILVAADIILCEDTRRTRGLLSHLGIRKTIESFYEHNEREKIPAILKKLEEGMDFAMVSDAGTPVLSDPGAKLVMACRNAGIKVIPVPGPSAITAALSVSGLPADKFMFLGFLPAKAAERKKVLLQYQNFPETLAIFEAPHRIKQSVTDLLEIFGDRVVCFCRELTKVFEETRLTTLEELSEQLENSEPKGEIVLIIAGAEISSNSKMAESDIEEAIKGMLEDGKSVKEIAQELSECAGLPKNQVYKKALEVRNRSGRS